MPRKHSPAAGSSRTSGTVRPGRAAAPVGADTDSAVEDAVRHIRANRNRWLSHHRPNAGSVPLSRVLADTLAADPARFTPAVAVRAVQRLIDGGYLRVQQDPPGLEVNPLADDPDIRALLALPAPTGESLPPAVAAAIAALRHLIYPTRVRLPGRRPADPDPAAVADAVEQIRAGLAVRLADRLRPGMSEAARAEAGRVPLADVLAGMSGHRPPRHPPAVYVAAADKLIADGAITYEVVGTAAGRRPVRLSDDRSLRTELLSGLPKVLKCGGRFVRATDKFINQLEDAGKVVGETLVVEVGDLSPEQQAEVDRLPAVDGFEPADETPRPRWTSRALTYGEWRCDFRPLKSAPSQEALLDAFQAGLWPSPLPITKGSKTAEEVGDLKSTVRNLMTRLNKKGTGPAPIAFKVIGADKVDWRSVVSAATPPTTPKSGPKKRPAKRPPKPTAKRKLK